MQPVQPVAQQLRQIHTQLPGVLRKKRRSTDIG